MVFLELSLFRKAFRFIGAVLCDVIYTLISKVYELFITVARLNILSSSQIQPIYQRITMILTIVMVFYVTLEFVKYTISPDTITDKEKGAGNILKRIIIVIVLIAFVPEIFTTAYKLQNRIIETQLISKIIIGTSNAEYTTYGNDFSANMLNLFYYYDEEACSSANAGLINECSEAKQAVAEKLEQIRQTGDSDIVDGINLASGKATFKEVNPAIKFNGILAILVGGFILYILIMYSIDVGTRYAQLIFLQVISPIAIMGYLLPKKDGIFQKWGKQCITTYIDLFLRIAIINFVLLITKVLGDAFQTGNIFQGMEVSNGLKAFVYIVLVLGLLAFAQRAPKLLGELFPSSGAAGIGMGLKAADRVAPGAARAIGAGAAGLTSLARRGVARAKGEHARRNKIKEDRLKENKPIDRKSMRDELKKDRLARKQAGKSYDDRRKNLEKASKDKANAERDLEAAQKSGNHDSITKAKENLAKAQARYDNLKNGGVSKATSERLAKAQENLNEAKRSGRYDTMSAADKKKLHDDLNIAQAQYNKEAQSYDTLRRSYIDASSKAAKSENQSMGAPIGLQVAGAALGGLATGVKTGAGATKLGDIGKKVQEADKKSQEAEIGRVQWLEEGGAATIGGTIDKKVAQTQQKWGIRTEAERIKYDVKTLEAQSKGLESQSTMEATVKSTKDAAKDRSADKLNKHEQKITMRAEDKIKIGKDKDGHDLYVDFKANDTTSQVLMRYEEQANTAKARAEAANAELVKAQIEGRPQSEIDRMKETVEVMSRDAEEKRFVKEQVHKKLAEYGFTRALENLAAQKAGEPPTIPDNEVDGVLANQVAASMKAVENARNSAKTVEYVKGTLDSKRDRELELSNEKRNNEMEAATTEEEKARIAEKYARKEEEIAKKYENCFNAFMNNDFRDYDTLDTIEAIITGHVGALKNERSAIAEAIRQINESSATDAANANAAGGGKK